jgi:hypothetical protein
MEEEPKRKQMPPQKSVPEPKKEVFCPPPRKECPPHHQGQNVGGFLKQLLPKNFDTSDLIIMLLLLLLAGDCEEDRTTAMLTLVLYLFM